MNGEKVPLLKEHRMDKIETCIECIDKYAFNRSKQRDCILNLYPDKGKSLEHGDKSIFRGMVLPSLRYLGLTLGRGQSIRASANGKLIIKSKCVDEGLHNRVLRAVIYEVDKYRFQFIDVLKKFLLLNPEDFVNELCSRIAGPSKKQKRERILRWLSLLEQVQLINHSSQRISVNHENLVQALNDTDVNLKELMTWQKHFFETYFESSRGSAGIVGITELRERVSIRLLEEHNIILTEKQFDEMLTRVLSETEEYIVSLGKPMGARDKLFEYKDNYFRTIFIRRTRKREGE
jgi:predicted transcriptional regulator